MTTAPARPRRPIRRMLTIALATIACLYLALCVIAYFAQHALMFPRAFAGPATLSAPPIPGAEVWWIDADDGSRIEAWWMPATIDPAAAPAPTVIFFHGNGELIEHSLALAEYYHSLGIHAAFLEYRGYGRSNGSPSQATITRDARILYDRVRQHPSVDPARIILHGRSMGGGVAGAMLAHHPPAAMILESSYTSVAAMFGRYLVPPFLCRSPFRTDTALAGYGGPTLILHGEHDTIIPIAHSRALAKIARNPTLATRPAGHNDLSADAGWYTATIADFLAANEFFPAPR